MQLALDHPPVQRMSVEAVPAAAEIGVCVHSRLPREERNMAAAAGWPSCPRAMCLASLERVAATLSAAVIGVAPSKSACHMVLQSGAPASRLPGELRDQSCLGALHPSWRGAGANALICERA